MLTSWPINGMRDTTEFPKDSVNVNVHVSYRQHLEGFCKLDGVGWTDYDGQRTKSGLTGADTRMRTFRKMYERLGLVTKAGGKISLTWLGRRISKIEQDEKDSVESGRANYHRGMQESVLGVLARFQWKNPIDEDGEYPSDFDVQPCLCLWGAMRQLDNKISLEEVNRVILRIMRMSELEAAIEKIKAARSAIAANPSVSLDVLMGPPVLAQTDTPCLHGLISFAGWGGLAISSQNAADGYRHLSDASIEVIDRILNNKPVYKNFADAADWMSYYIGEDPEVSAVVANVFDTQDVQSAFAIWLKAENLNGSGKAASYLTALDDVDVIIRSLVVKFEIPSVYAMPIKNLESLQKFLASEKNKENANAGSSALNSIPGLHGISYWRDGHCGAAIGKLIEFKELIAKDKDGRTGSSTDVLSVALKQFSKKRKDCDWCADNTDNDATKPRPGYVANAKLRAALPMTNNLGTDAQVVQWFKDYTYPDGKSWLDGIDTDGCAAFGGYVNYLVTGGAAVARPEKFTKSLESAVKAIVKPESECFYNKDIHSVLKDLGLLGFEFKEDFDEDDYQDALHAQRVIKRWLKDMGEKQIVEWDAAANQAKPNDKDPDFLTVNEFLWFVKENKQEISRIAKEKAMAKQQKKPTKEKVTTGTATISGLLANKEDSLMTMLTAALLTKPLVILAGVSGTGKSRMVRHLAYKTCLDKDLQPQGGNAPGNFKMIQVKPNWHDSADLLGYRSVVSGNHEFVTTEFVKFVLKAHAYPDTPFFVCLDEMNLAPVEHYFAEFLSACESIRKNEQGVWISDPIVSPTDFDGEIINLGGDVKFESDDATLDATLKARKALIEKEGLFIPRNLFVVGTVNMDDTTNGFSRKVLDRAMTIEMNEVKFDELQKKDEGLSVAAANVFKPEEIKKFIDREDFDGQTMLNDEFRDQMEALRGKLEKSPFALAYRFARETTLYRKALMTILDPAEVVKDANGAPKKDAASAPIDAKRACGEIALDHMILMKVLPRFTGTVTERETIIKDVGEYLDALIKDKKVGKVKLDDMVERAKHNGGYLSFWP